MIVGIYYGIKISITNSNPVKSKEKILSAAFKEIQTIEVDALSVYTYGKSINVSGIMTNLYKENFNLESSWLKLVDINKLDEINKRIDDIDPNTSSGSTQAQTRGDLPSIGEESKTYFVIAENATYRWDNHTLTYKCCGRDYTEIKTIDGVGFNTSAKETFHNTIKNLNGRAS